MYFGFTNTDPSFLRRRPGNTLRNTITVSSLGVAALTIILSEFGSPTLQVLNSEEENLFSVTGGVICTGTGAENVACGEAGQVLTKTINGSGSSVGMRWQDAGSGTGSISIGIESPTTSDNALAQHKFSTAVTINRISCSTDVGTATIQFDERSESTPNSAGTDVMSSTLVCDNDTQATTSFDNAGIAADAILNLDIDATASTPGVVRIHIDYSES